MDGKNSHAGHRSRLRKRFLASGYDSLYDHELLELMLFYARPVVNTNNIAHSLKEEFGSVGKVLSADIDKLCSVDGVGSNGALFIKLMNDFGISYLQTSHSSETLNSREQLCSCFLEEFRNSNANICSLLCLGGKSELLRNISIPVKDIVKGVISQKELATMILKSGAFSVCIGLNHGSDYPIPNDYDYIIVHIFSEMLSAIGIVFNDCIICGYERTFSMRSKGAFAF